MKKALSILLALVLLASALVGCGQNPAAPAEPAQPAPNAYNDGRARPSSCGQLQVVDGKLCAEDGEPVILRGVSLNGLITSESFLSEQLFRELSEDVGVNLFRLPLYTYGVGIVGYCTKGDKDRHKADIALGVELAREYDMYVLID